MSSDKLTFTHDGRTFRCWVDMEGRTAGGMTRPSSAAWVVEVDGVMHVPFDASPDDTPADVERKVVAWYDADRPKRKTAPRRQKDILG